MRQDLTLRRFSPATVRNYLLYFRRFSAFYMRSPEELGEAEIRAFLLHQVEVEGLSYSSYRQVYSALKFLYSVRLGRPGEAGCIPFPKHQPRRLPKVLTAEELTAFFTALRKPKYRALFMTCYAAGLRLGEASRTSIRSAWSFACWAREAEGVRPYCRRVCSSSLRWALHGALLTSPTSYRYTPANRQHRRESARRFRASGSCQGICDNLSREGTALEFEPGADWLRACLIRPHQA